jgi:hypothetical protein
MIIEAAFLKLPELLMGASFDFGGTIEASIRHLFATATLMELIGRGNPRPQDCITSEKPYWLPPSGSPRRADLKIDLSQVRGRRMDQYGTQTDNWIELKTCFADKYSGTNRVGGIINDLFRLCLYPEELPGAPQNGRFFMLITDQPFERCLPERPWLSELLQPGTRDIVIDSSSEPPSIRASLEPKAPASSVPASASLRGKLGVNVQTFIPLHDKPNPVFWGALARISSFEVTIGTVSAKFDERTPLSVTENDQLSTARQLFFAKESPQTPRVSEIDNQTEID